MVIQSHAAPVGASLSTRPSPSVLVDKVVHPNAFSLEITGSSTPRFRISDIVVIDPDQPPKTGDVVFAKVGGGDGALFEYCSLTPQGGGEAFVLLSPDSLAIAARSDVDHVQIIGTMEVLVCRVRGCDRWDDVVVSED